MAKQLRLREFGAKFGMIFLALFGSIVVISLGWPPKLGIDLGGGAILVFKVDTTKTTADSAKMDDLVLAISKRINPGGVKEILVRKFGNDMVEITLPAIAGSTDDEKRAEKDAIKKIINQQGKMEFHILATHLRNESLIETAMKKPEGATVYIDGSEMARWCEIRKSTDNKEEDQMRGDPSIAVRLRPSDKRYEALVLTGKSDPYDVSGDDLINPHSGVSSDMSPCVDFSFNDQGAARFSKLTSEHMPQENGFKFKLAIILDNELQTAPSLLNAIGKDCQITGTFTEKEVEELVQILDAGSLPAALEKEPVRDMVTGPLLGADTIEKSKYAMIISAILVPLFMFWYYRFPGLVANIALVLNMIMLVAVMILIKAPFTLPALAGLALTVGMAVDNNVLIYERLREELEHGAALRMAIRNSFHRAGVVIIDANITHLIAASVLWRVGTEQVKGFAVTFFVGAILSIWATMFVAHVLFDVAERKRWIRSIHMMHIIGHTKIDFMGWFPLAATFSVLITVLGLVVAFARGPGLFDIDFVGGVSVQTIFRDEHKIKDIREKVEKVSDILKDVTVRGVQLQNEPEGRRFLIDTSNHDTNQVKEQIKALFGSELVTSQLSYGPEVKEPDGAKSPGVINLEKPTEGPSLGPAMAVPAATNTIKPASPKPSESTAIAVKLPETKTAETKTAETKTTATKPVESKSSETPPPSKPAEPRSTESKPASTTAPVPKATDSKQSRHSLPSLRLPSLSLVAMAGPEAFLLAQAEKPQPTDSSSPAAKSTDTNSAATSPAATKPADPKPTETKPTETKPTDTKPTETKPADSAAAKSTATAPPKPENPSPKTQDPKPKPEVPATEATKKPSSGPAPMQRPSAGVSSGTNMPLPEASFQAELSFSTEQAQVVDKNTVSHAVPIRQPKDEVVKLAKDSLKAVGIAAESVRLVIDVPSGATADKDLSLADRWTVQLTSLPEQPPLTKEKFDQFLKKMTELTGDQPYYGTIDTIGEAVAKDTEKWAVIALVSSWSLIILYLWIRFQGVAFGVAAVIALIHDVLVMLGAIAFSSYLSGIPLLSAITLIEPFKINLPIVAAFMTIIGYSVNDTIVVFDRIREIRGKSPDITRQMINDATNQTLSRTLLTSFTVLLVVFILYVAGGEAVHGFAFALFIGVLTGTYSSIYVAAPILLWLLHPKEMVATDAK